jgi:hypothetical protein
MQAELSELIKPKCKYQEMGEDSLMEAQQSILHSRVKKSEELPV